LSYQTILTHLALTDIELISEIINNNNTHFFEVLYDKYSKRVYNKCYSFVNNEEEAKDLTQDIFLKLFVKISSFKGNSKFSSWFYSFTYNHCINYVTRNSKRKYERRLPETFDLENYADDTISLPQTQEDLENKLNAALNKIPSNDKKIIQLKYQENLSIKKIEDVLGIGTSAVKMRIKRAKEKLMVLCA